MEMDRAKYNSREGGNSNLPIIIAMIGVCVVVLSAMITMFVVMNGRDKKNVNNEPPVLTITQCPETIYADENTNATLVLSGTMMDKNTGCELKINGKSVQVSKNKGETVNWTASFVIPAGVTEEYIFELRNDNNISVSETRKVYCHSIKEVVQTPTPAPKVTSPLQAGSEFVKKKSGGLNIRRYAGTQYDVIDFINGTDYTSRMVFTGSYDVDYQGYTWYQVISPNGRYGYVRSDLVKRVS